MVQSGSAAAVTEKRASLYIVVCHVLARRRAGQRESVSITVESGVILYCFLRIVLALCDEGK